MNNNTYYRTQPKKKATAYLMPFIIILILIGIVVFGWRALNSAFLGGSASSPNEKVFLNIEAGSAKAMTVSSSEWKNAPDNINLYSGERIKTGGDGRVTLTFPDKSLVRMDKDSELEFSKIKQKAEATQTEIALSSGQVWAKIEPTANPDSSFAIVTDLLTVDSVGATLNVTSEGGVYVMSGSAQIGIKAEDEIIKTVNLGVGQQIVITPEVLTQIQEGKNPEILFALDDAFKKSGWYRWNRQKDGMINGFEEPDSNLTSGGYSGYGEPTTQENALQTETEADVETINPDRLVAISKPSNDSETNESSISVSGTYDSEKVSGIYVNGKKASLADNKWTVSSVALIEGKNTINVEAETDAGRSKIDPLIITMDSQAPEAPKVTDPTATEGETGITVDDVEQVIKGTVSKDTFAVIVNDYQLGKYVPGSGTFEYYAKLAFGNLKVGDNEYIMYAEDKAGNRSVSTTLTLTLEQETVDNSDTKPETTTTTTEEKADALPVAESTGGVSITAPNDGKSFSTSDTAFEIQGSVPSGTVKVVVNDYTLSKYVAGSATFSYKASSTFGNLEIGAKNTYEATAYDADGKVLGKASITIDVASGSASAPTITMPSATGTYSTSLNEVVIGGTVGKWATAVKINGATLSEYIPGSEEWRKTVQLSIGENSYSICAEQNDTESGCATIKITYQP